MTGDWIYIHDPCRKMKKYHRIVQFQLDFVRTACGLSLNPGDKPGYTIRKCPIPPSKCKTCVKRDGLDGHSVRETVIKSGDSKLETNKFEVGDKVRVIRTGEIGKVIIVNKVRRYGIVVKIGDTRVAFRKNELIKWSE